MRCRDLPVLAASVAISDHLNFRIATARLNKRVLALILQRQCGAQGVALQPHRRQRPEIQMQPGATPEADHSPDPDNAQSDGRPAELITASDKQSH
jgi:hypothetical protein